VNFDDNKELFVEEARDILAQLENSLVALEKAPSDRPLIGDIFRALHTLKGSGAMFGFTELSEFAHHVEGLFDNLRQGRLAVDSRIIDIGLRSRDCIALLLGGSDGGLERLALVREIQAVAGGGETVRAGPAAEPTAEPTAGSPDGPGSSALSAPAPEDRQGGRTHARQDGRAQVFRIAFRPQPQILHRGVKLEALFRELRGLGSCHFELEAGALPPLEALEPTTLFLSWTITLSTHEGPAAVRAVFMFVEDYAELSIEAVALVSGEVEASVPRLGEILVGRGRLDAAGVEEIRRGQKLFGEAAVETGKVTREEVEAALAEQEIVRSAASERETKQESSTVRVRKEKLDSLIDLVGELVILQAGLEQEAKKEAAGIFAAISENLARLTADLRDSIMGIRMVPLAESFASFQRLVRDLARQLGKELRLELSGEGTELDKNVIELLKDPLVHIIRNSADHGIEEPGLREQSGKPRAGRISIRARQLGARVEIAIADDGAGLDLERIRERAIERKLLERTETDERRIMAMIFEPGFSTAEKTTDVSGRGVGMDVVKRNIERLRGEVSLATETGRGTTVTLSIPLTLVIIEGLLVRIAGQDFIITLSEVEECVDLTAEVRKGGQGNAIINLRGTTIPTISLRAQLGLPGVFEGLARLVIVTSEGTTVGLEVDEVLGRKQVVIKPLSGAIRRIKAIFGATILGDGSVALILDLPEIIKTMTGQEGRSSA
jgi:two-component system chemotaxis sensor kinase CheA